jgi:hypothetical protein
MELRLLRLAYYNRYAAFVISRDRKTISALVGRILEWRDTTQFYTGRATKSKSKQQTLVQIEPR